MMAEAVPSFSKNMRQSVVVHSIRLFFLALVVLVAMVFQVIEPRIQSSETFLPIYALVGVSFLIQCLFFLFFKHVQRSSVLSGMIFVVEAFYVALLIFFVGIQQSLLIFLFLVNIILCGVLFQRKGAIALAVLTSILFSFLLSLDTTVQGQTAFLAVGINNIAFFSVAYLSGYLSEQLNFMGVQLHQKVRDLKALKNLNDLVLQTMNSGLLTLEKDGRVVQANRAAVDFLSSGSSSAGSIIGQSVMDLFPKLPAQFLEMSETASFDYEDSEREPPKSLRFHRAPLEDNLSSASGIVLTFQDETEVKRLQSRVRQSEKLAAIGQLAAGIAHEIRNPLASISGSIQLLQGGASSDSDNSKLMKIVNREIDRLNHLITEFLDYASPEAPKKDPVNLANLIREIIELTDFQNDGGRVRKKMRLGDSCVVLGNADKLKQAFLNIIVNGYQALEKTPDAELRIDLSKVEDQFVDIKICDNGCGIKEDVRLRIFEPFLTTKSKGTGLGLAITHSIFETHGAVVDVQSTVGAGTCFHIRFPAPESVADS